MNCPHCGAKSSDESDADIQVFECGTEIIENEWQSIPSDCYERQISQLKAELAQSVRRDDPRLYDALRVLENASFANDDWKAAHNAHKQLKSIIEGK